MTMMTTTTTMTKIINLCSTKCDTSLESQNQRDLESDDDGDDNDNNNNDKIHKSYIVSSAIPRWNHKIKEIWNLMMMTTMTTMTKIINLCSIKCDEYLVGT